MDAPATPSPPLPATTPQAPLDVLIVGAGLSGIGAAWLLQQRCPDHRYAIVEARDAIGGTWDLFRYPGVRSDSDMYTLGYRFRPWLGGKAIADGPDILAYVRSTAEQAGITRRIHFGRRVVEAAWCSAEACWTVQLEHRAAGAAADAPPERQTLHARFLHLCSGYYSYGDPHRPHFEGEEDFPGPVVHPQFWPAQLDWRGKRVVVIGSGATAVTLVPAMAEAAAHVTMLQRSPSYVVTRPAVDAIATGLRRWLPEGLAYGLTRWKNVLLGMFFFQLARRRPERVKERLLHFAALQLPPNYDVQQHFTPRYNPWDQRMCLVPDGDLFKAIREQRASVVTDTIERFTPTGIRTTTGRELAADIIVVATGLKLVTHGEAALRVDGRLVQPHALMTYKGMMFGGVPNLVQTFGYTNASWTLKADLTAEFVCRLLRRMRRRGEQVVVPAPDAAVAAAPFLDFSSGYVQRGLPHLPQQGQRRPWRLFQNYLLDMLMIRHGRLADGVLQFGRAGAAPAALQPAEPARHGAA